MLVVTLAGAVPERTLLTLARDLQDRLEALPNVLEVDIAGEREEVVEIVIDPLRVEAYDLQLETILGSSSATTSSSPPAPGTSARAGSRSRSRAGRGLDDLLEMPVKVARTGWSRSATSPPSTGPSRTPRASPGSTAGRRWRWRSRSGSAATSSRRSSRSAVWSRRSARWPSSVEVGYLQDKSGHIRTMLDDLGNNVLTAVALTMIITVAMLGLRSSLLVGLAVPVSFLCAWACSARWGSPSTSWSCSR